MSGLLSLPTELLQEIGSLIGEDLRRLRAVNIQLQLVSEPLYFKSMKVSLGKSGSQLKALATGTTRAAPYVQHLTIIRNNALGVPDDMLLYLESALCKLKNLQSLIWHVGLTAGSMIEQEAAQRILDSLGPLQSLHTLVVIAHADIGSSYAPFLNLSCFRNIKSFSVCFDSGLPSSLANAVRELIDVNALHLDALRIAATASSSVDLGNLLPEGKPLLRLRHLSLLRLDLSEFKRELLHLPSLQSFTLLSTTISDSPDGIWDLLRAEETWITRLEVSRVDASLLEYLESFSALERLSVILPELWQDASEEFLGRLLVDVLPKHHGSMVSITLQRIPWSFLQPLVSDCMIDLGKCTELGLDIPLSEIKYTGGETLTSMLRYTDELPNLQCLTVIVLGVGHWNVNILNAKVRVMRAIRRIRLVQTVVQRSNYIIQIQCGDSRPLRYN